MRDINRIKPFCDEFAELWATHPYLRFGQIMHNFTRYLEINYKKDIFYMEDDELMKMIREWFGQ